MKKIFFSFAIVTMFLTLNSYAGTVEATKGASEAVASRIQVAQAEEFHDAVTKVLYYSSLNDPSQMARAEAQMYVYEAVDKFLGMNPDADSKNNDEVMDKFYEAVKVDVDQRIAMSEMTGEVTVATIRAHIEKALPNYNCNK